VSEHRDCCPHLSVVGATAGGSIAGAAVVVKGVVAAAEVVAVEVLVDQLCNMGAWEACRAALAAYDDRTSLQAGELPFLGASCPGRAVVAVNGAEGMVGVEGVADEAGAAAAQSFVAGVGAVASAVGARDGRHADWLRAFV